MPPPPHVRLTWSGTLGEGSPAPEIWSMSLALAESTSASSPDRDSLKTLAGGMSAAWLAGIGAMVNNTVRLTRTRLARVNSQGFVVRTDGGAYVQGDDLTVRRGAATSSPLPPQCSLAVSLQSQQAGSTGRGRFFIPIPDIVIEPTDLRLSVQAQTNLLARMKTFLDDVNTRAAAGGLGRVVVASGGSVTQSIEPGLRTVTSVRLGRVVDTIRTRRNDLIEGHASSNLA